MCWSGLMSEDLYWVIDPILGLIWQTNRELSPGDCINSSPYILTICHANTWSETLIQQALFIVILWFAPASRCDNFSYADWQPICFFGFHVDENYVRNTLYMLYSDTCHTFCFGTLWQLFFSLFCFYCDWAAMEFLEVPVQKTRNVRFVDLDTDFPPQFSFQKPGGSDGNVSEIGSYFSL